VRGSHRARAARAERTRELEHSKPRIEVLITTSAQIVWTTAEDGSVAQDSPSWRAYTGQTYDEWKGTGWLNAIHPDDRAKSLAAWRGAVESRCSYDVEPPAAYRRQLPPDERTRRTTARR
jgi:PAS domain-containing protein